MRYLFVMNDPPYGTERCCNALRLARALLEHGDAEVKLGAIARRGKSASAAPAWMRAASAAKRL